MATSPIVTHSLFQNSASVELPAAGSSFALVPRAPAPRPDEVESASKLAIEVVVSWGDNIVHVAHIAQGRGFSLGEGGDFVMPAELLGAERVEIVSMQGTSMHASVPSAALADLDQQGKASHLAGGASVELSAGTRVRIGFAGSELSVVIASVAAGRKLETGLMLGVAAGALQHIGVSFLLHAGLVGSMAFFMPSMSAEDTESNSRDQTLMMQRFLNASAERELEAEKATSSGETAENSGGNGERAKGPEGKMGSTTAAVADKAWAKQGPSDNANPQLSRAQELQAARTEGFVGMLNAMNFADPNAPTSPWGDAAALGRDSQSFMGNMWGAQPGDAYGMNGGGLSGTGEGGGGTGVGMPGLGEVGTGGHGTGCVGENCVGGMGRGHGGPLAGPHKQKVMTMRSPGAQVNGRLPAEIIQRAVRLNNGRFRMCYENALKTNPTLAGRVSTRFVIGRDGAVASVQDGGSNLPDQGVVQCVVRSFSNLSFPAPEAGVVTVTYPIMFAPGE